MSQIALEFGLPVISVDISGRSAGIGMRSGIILGSVSPALDTTSEPLRGESRAWRSPSASASRSGRLNKIQSIFSSEISFYVR